MSQWNNARDILCVRLDNMGDVLMTTPALRALKESVPDRHLTLLTSPSGAAVANHIPEVDQVIMYDAPWVKCANTHDASSDRRMISRLDAADYDAAVIFTVYSQCALPAALMCMMADIPLRLGHSRENPYLLLTDWVRETEPQSGVRHEVQRQLDLVASVGAHTEDRHLSFALNNADRGALQAKLSRRGVDLRRPWLVLHPGATAASRRYSAAQYTAAAQGIRARLDCQILVTGSDEEVPLCHAMQESLGRNVFSLAGELTLGEFGTLIAGSAVLLSNNSGPVHIAAAVGTPVVDLYALTNPQHTPWLVPNRVLFHDVPCRNCYKSVCPEGHHACLAEVAPQDVVTAVCDLWHEHGGRRACFSLVPPEGDAEDGDAFAVDAA
ncbi:MAG: waaF [Rhodocyclales bacterium]|nr:waaF [Rhodocyclales bacterium]